MIFWRILDNTVHPDQKVDKLGFEKSEGLRIPDEYLQQKNFTVFRTSWGIGDWGVISAMPRLLKQKYPDCKVYIPSKNLIKKLFGIDTNIMYVMHVCNAMYACMYALRHATVSFNYRA